MIRETRLEPERLIQPYFVVHGTAIDQPIGSMPGQSRLSVDVLVDRAKAARDVGVAGVLLFGIPQSKDARASSAADPQEIVPRAIRALTAAVPELLVVADVCCCEYSSHGHCGIVDEHGVRNDETVELLTRASVVYADAGAGVIAPSDMMDGRVASIRSGLDHAGHQDVAILSYAVKYASAYYGPFRDAADSAPKSGDRRGYQMDPANRREAVREATLDVDEGADMIMVKPALPCLDIIADLRDRFEVPIAAYQVSGEYAQLKAAGANGWLDEQRAMDEALVAMRRAGADVIITYDAVEVARRLRGRA